MPATNPHSPKLYYWTHYKAFVLDWEAVTRDHTYEDGTKSFNELADYAPRRWDLIYTGVDQTDLAVFEAHFNEKRYSRTFTFIDKEGNTRPDVRYESFSSTHNMHKSWDNTVTITLVEYDDSNVIPELTMPTGLTAETGGAEGEVDIDWTESPIEEDIDHYVLRIRVPE
jgi:hypothetical protein